MITDADFLQWIVEEGYIYIGDHDYVYPDIDGTIGEEDLYKEYLKIQNRQN